MSSSKVISAVVIGAVSTSLDEGVDVRMSGFGLSTVAVAVPQTNEIEPATTCPSDGTAARYRTK